ncbi:uncharacterized protein Dvar_66640 [Desulfosarcina variabilis str. Montpellier]|uniref:hypothetical protein n=1 Tax=Desulfosarcina variabilis TaxID=2300 RepID=UPI003AFB1437
MSEDAKNKVPAYLVDLLQPTPSGTSKLIAAWDGLSVETQIQILLALEETKVPEYQSKKVRYKALDSPNAFVRYLAAKQFCFFDDYDEEGKALKERIETDSDPLVKYCLLDIADFKNEEFFFSHPQEARLAIIRKFKGWGTVIASIITYAVDNLLGQARVSESDLSEILEDYLKNPSFIEYYQTNKGNPNDGYGEYLTEKEFKNDHEALWNLILKVPKDISYILLENLPETVGPIIENHSSISVIPENILDQLTKKQIETLLFREDIVLKDYRHKLFNQPLERFDGVRSAAIAYNFDLTYDDFSELLEKPDSEKRDILRDLSSMASDLSLVFYEAMHDIILEYHTDIMEYAGDAQWKFERKVKSLKGWQLENQLIELRLYRLAKRAVPWNNSKKDISLPDKLEFMADFINDRKKSIPPRGELEFLSDFGIDGDTWATFKSFSGEWANRYGYTEKLERFLPQIYEIEDNDIEEGPIDKQEEQTAEFEEIIIESINSLKNDMNRLQAIIGSQKVFIYIVIGFFIILLFLIH